MIVKSARKDELPQTFTTQDVEDIKSAIDVPRANVTILNTVYSPEETKIGVWREYRTVEGQQVLMQKPLYQKRVIGHLPSSSGDITLGLSSIEIQFLGGGVVIDDEGWKASMPGCYGSPTDFVQIDINQNKVDLYTFFSGNRWQNAPYEIHICYIKTTDEWEVVE